MSFFFVIRAFGGGRGGGGGREGRGGAGGEFYIFYREATSIALKERSLNNVEEER